MAANTNTLQTERVGVSSTPLAMGITICGAAMVLWQREGRMSAVLPGLCVLLIASWFVKVRLTSHTAANLARAGLFTLVFAMYRTHPASDIGTYIDPYWLDIAGEIGLCEAVIRAWCPSPRGNSAATLKAMPVVLTGLAVVAASNTFDENLPKLSMPVYMAVLLVALQSYRANSNHAARKRAALNSGIAIALTIGCGYFLYSTLMIYRDGITAALTHAFNPARYYIASTSLSEESHLASMFGQEGTQERVFRIKTKADVSYMRGSSMYQYRMGTWGPSGRSGDRKYISVGSSELEALGKGEPAEVTRLSQARGIFFAPINAVSLQIDDAVNLRWARDDGGSIRADAPLPDTYKMIVGDREHQGPLAVQPGDLYRRQLLDLPADLNPRIRALALRITAGSKDAMRKARAIQAYLPSHHGYSLSIHVDKKDPLSDFLFSEKPAHCEFFASAAVILMRCAGIPARYTVGYYAHEAEDNSIIVRQRDAHAWAEAWIEGKGWVTIDATPSEGKPDRQNDKIPGWRRFMERVQDFLSNLRSKITPEAILKFAGGLVAFVLLLYLLQSRFHILTRLFHRQERVVAERYVYTAGPHGLAEIIARFEKSSARFGLRCPPGITWAEWLAIAETPAVTATAVSRATEFLKAYNRLRFGAECTPEAMTSLASMLADYEHELKSATERKGGQK